jgi:hypothetical protein
MVGKRSNSHCQCDSRALWDQNLAGQQNAIQAYVLRSSLKLFVGQLDQDRQVQREPWISPLGMLGGEFTRGPDAAGRVAQPDSHSPFSTHADENFWKSGIGHPPPINLPSRGLCANVSRTRLMCRTLFLDLSMSLINGLTAGRILKRSMPETHLVLFTSFDNLLSRDDLRCAGFSALIPKG